MCNHANTREIKTTVFFAPVGPADDQEPRAHGGVTVHEECTDCGARRAVNVNGIWVERGTWSESRAERVEIAHRLRAALPPVPMAASTETVEVRCLEDGTLEVMGDQASVAGYPGLEAARARRAAWLKLEAAEANI